MAFSVRTIFLALRGIDQTGRAIEKPAKDLNDLEKAQRRLSRSGYRLMFAGAAFTAFGYMANRALFSVLEHTTKGTYILDDFKEGVERVKNALAEAIINKFGTQIEDTIGALDKLAENENLMDLIAGISVPLTVGITVMGIGLITLGVGVKIASALASGLIAAGELATATGLGAAQIAAGVLGLITIPVIVGFSVGYLTWWLQNSEAGERLKESLKEWWEGLWGEEGPQAYPGMGPGDVEQYYKTKAGPMGGPRDVGDTGDPGETPDTVETTIYVDNINTQADEEELEEFINDVVVNAVHGGSGKARTRRLRGRRPRRSGR